MNQKEHTAKVKQCLDEIHKEIDKRNFNGISKLKRDKAVKSIIKQLSLTYGLKNGNIEAIFYCRYVAKKQKTVLT